MKFTVKKICQNIWNLEEKYELNHMEIQNTYPWQLIRMYLYYEITQKVNIFESAQQSKLSITDKINTFLPFIKNSALNSPLKGNYHKDILLFDHPRKIIFQNEYKDIYSYFLIDTFRKFNKSFEIIESPYLNKHFTSKQYQKENNIKFNDKILLGSFIYKTKNRGKLPFTDKEIEKIETIKKEIENIFSIEINLFQIIEDHILNFKYEYKKYLELLDKRNPKQVYLVVAYENKSLVAACKNKNIETIELQHGTISKYHLGYSYPKNVRLYNGSIKEIEYFPDKILSFGEYWKDASRYPIRSNNIIPIGFPYFEENSKGYMNQINKNIENNKNNKNNKNIEKHIGENIKEYNGKNTKRINKKRNDSKKEQILFISQGVIGKYLSKLAYDLALKLDLDKYNIVYKLHPGEYETWKKNYEYLNKAEQLNNFQVIDNSKTQLYNLFNKSDYQVGAFSTAIYEGLSFGCKTFIVNLPGIEYLDDLIEKNIVKKVNNSEDIMIYLTKPEKYSLKEYDPSYFFKNYDENIFKEILK